MPAILAALLPMLIQAAPGLIAPLISLIFPTLAPKASALVAAVAATTAVQAATPSAGPVAVLIPAAIASSPITFLQELLTGLGHPVTIDGELGTETIGAIEAELGIVPGSVLSVALSDVLSKLV